VEELIQEAVAHAGINDELDQDIEQELNNLAQAPQLQIPAPAPFPLLPLDEAGAPPPTGESVIIIERDEHNSLQEFAINIREAASLFSIYNKTLRLIESSGDSAFTAWDKLEECVAEISDHPRVSDKMKMRCFLINKDNVRTFQLLQSRFKLQLNTLFYMGKMNLLHISCDTGWAGLAAELVNNQGMDVNLGCPSLHMRPAGLTPLMLAAGAGHASVVEALLSSGRCDLETRDSYGMTALFHTCNHGAHRSGDQHGHFRRLWSWDLSQAQLDGMEASARAGALPSLQLLARHGADLFARDKTGASLLTRAASVDSFPAVIRFLAAVGCRVTENVLNWVRAVNPNMAEELHSLARTPASLLAQARTVIWLRLRAGASTDSTPNPISSYPERLEVLARQAELPHVLTDYLQCL